jgi:hypothetical protein
MRDLLPETLLNLIRDRYLAGVADAEAAFDQSQADEDAVTGALGQAIAMRYPITFSDGQQIYRLSIDYKKLRGRGANAPEKRFGSDGIFQISVTTADGVVVRRKGLPFQAKSRWRTVDKRLVQQAKVMQQATQGGVIVDFGSTGYFCSPIESVIRVGGSRTKLVQAGGLRRLGQTLANEFLDCKIGHQGLYYDPASEEFHVLAHRNLEFGHLLTTSVLIARAEV